MHIKIEEYLSKDEIKDICTEEVKRHVRDAIGNISVGSDRSAILLRQLAKNLAKDGVQEIIPDFKDLINEHIKSEIDKVTLADFFFESYGWRSQGNKILNGVLGDNKALLDAKIKEIFAPKLI